MSLVKLAMNKEEFLRMIIPLVGGISVGGVIGYGMGKEKGKESVLEQMHTNLQNRAFGLGRGARYGRGLAIGPRDGRGIGRYGFCQDGTPCNGR